MPVGLTDTTPPRHRGLAARVQRLAVFKWQWYRTGILGRTRR
jgi:hypothetical protein